MKRAFLLKWAQWSAVSNGWCCTNVINPVEMYTEFTVSHSTGKTPPLSEYLFLYYTKPGFSENLQ